MYLNPIQPPVLPISRYNLVREKSNVFTVIHWAQSILVGDFSEVKATSP